MRDLRRVQKRLFNQAPGSNPTISLLADNVVKKLRVEGFIHLSTPAATNPATGVLSDAPYTIIQDLYVDLGGKQRQKASGAIHRIVSFIKKKAYPYSDTVAAPAAGATSTIRFSLPIYFGWPMAKDNPSMGMIDFSNYKDQVNLILTLGDIGQLFTTPNDTVVTGIDLKIITHEIPGLKINKADQVYCEPVVISYAVANSNDQLTTKMDTGDRDYQGILIYTETAPNVPDDGIDVLTGVIKLDGSTPGSGGFNLRSLDSFAEVKDDNYERLPNKAMLTGYAYLDFVEDDKVVSGAVGTSALTSLVLTTGVTGGATNTMKLISLVTRK